MTPKTRVDWSRKKPICYCGSKFIKIEDCKYTGDILIKCRKCKRLIETRHRYVIREVKPKTKGK